MSERLGDGAIASMVRAAFPKGGSWTGTATDLLAVVASNASEDVLRDFPKDGARLAARLRRIEGKLAGHGIGIAFARVGNKRTRQITLTSNEAPAPSNKPPPTRDTGAVLREWDAGVQQMHLMPRPPSGFTPMRWREVCDDASDLLDDHAARLASLGWATEDLFGVDPKTPGTSDLRSRPHSPRGAHHRD